MPNTVVRLAYHNNPEDVHTTLLLRESTNTSIPLVPLASDGKGPLLSAAALVATR